MVVRAGRRGGFADLYVPENMPANLREAHQSLDAAVDTAFEAAYGVDFGGDEERIVEHLFKLYAQAAAEARDRGCGR